MHKKIRQLEAIIEKENLKVISVDVFDTLLLRSSRPELQRFKDFSKAQHTAFPIERIEGYLGLYKARLTSGKVQFDKACKLKGLYEVTYTNWLKGMSGSEFCCSNLEGEMIQKYLDIELEIEKNMLVPQRELWAFLRRQSSLGLKVVLCSDMYLDANSIRILIRKIMEDDLSYCLYVSSEWQKTKRDGTLFLAMLEDLNLAPQELLHVGDNFISDVQVPKTLDIHTLYFPRSAVWKALHLLRKKAYKFYLSKIAKLL